MLQLYNPKPKWAGKKNQQQPPLHSPADVVGQHREARLRGHETVPSRRELHFLSGAFGFIGLGFRGLGFRVLAYMPL